LLEESSFCIQRSLLSASRFHVDVLFHPPGPPKGKKLRHRGKLLRIIHHLTCLLCLLFSLGMKIIKSCISSIEVRGRFFYPRILACIGFSPHLMANNIWYKLLKLARWSASFPLPNTGKENLYLLVCFEETDECC